MKTESNLLFELMGDVVHRSRKNSDLLQNIDFGQHFKSRHAQHICFVDGDDGGDGGKGDGGKGDDGDKLVTLTMDQLNKLIDERLDGGGEHEEEDKHKDKSASDKAKERAKAEEERKKDRDTDRALLLADMQFDGFLKDNKEYFPDAALNIREDAEEEESEIEKKVQLMHAGAARLFFERESNLKILGKEDKEYVEGQILAKRYDTQVDAQKAWDLVKAAVNTLNLLADNGRRRGAASGDGKSGGKTGFESLDKRLSEWFPKHVVDITR